MILKIIGLWVISCILLSVFICVLLVHADKITEKTEGGKGDECTSDEED